MLTPFSPYGQNPFTQGALGHPAQRPQSTKLNPLDPPEKGLPRALNYYADYSGCGFWRMLWPEHMLNAYQKMVISGQTTMVLDPRYYEGIKCVRIQRQATPTQLKFVEHLRKISQDVGFRIVYEIDDIVFREDIPDYNKFKPAFTPDNIRETSEKIMMACDEVTVSCDFMKDYYQKKTGHKQITVIPNYPPKFWLGHIHDEQLVRDNYRTNKSRPRILYPGSGAHFDVDNRVKHKDDFAHVVDAVIKSRSRFKWVFVGAFPQAVLPYIRNGEMEFHTWKSLYDYPEFLKSLNVNAVVAPLQDNNFNRAKSDVKYLEASAIGVPFFGQDIDTYAHASLRFTDGDDMVSRISNVLGTKKTYLEHCRRGREMIESRWLESPDNYGKYLEIYTLPYGDPKRKLINNIQ